MIRLNDVLGLNFGLINLKVVSHEGRSEKKIGKIEDYTVDSATLTIFQIIVQRPFMQSLKDAQLTINRSQITEIDDYKVTIMHDKQKVSVPQKKTAKEEAEEFVPNFTNPFRKPDYSPVEDDIDDNWSKTSE